MIIYESRQKSLADPRYVDLWELDTPKGPSIQEPFTSPKSLGVGLGFRV